MKKNMKKLASLLFMVMLVLGLTACGSTDEPVETVVETAMADELADFLVANIVSMPLETMQMYIDMDAEELQMILDQSGIPMTAEAFKGVFNGYASAVEEYGAYVSTDGYELKGDEEEATHVTELTFEVHPAKITLVYNEKGIATSGTLDPVLSTGEILEKAGLNTVIGMGTVFVVLIFISCIIALLPKLTGLITGTGKKKEEPVKEAPKAAMAPVAAAEEELADDLESVAVIAAAIAAYTGTSTDDFVVRSIKRSTTNKWKKA